VVQDNAKYKERMGDRDCGGGKFCIFLGNSFSNFRKPIPVVGISLLSNWVTEIFQGLFATLVLDYRWLAREISRDGGAVCDYRTLHCGQEITAFGELPTNR